MLSPLLESLSCGFLLRERQTHPAAQAARYAHYYGRELEGRDRSFFDALIAKGVYADWREPGTVRMALAPLYSSFKDLARLEVLLSETLAQP